MLWQSSAFFGYWRAWSRVLQDGNLRDGHDRFIDFVEVDLTPVGGWGSKNCPVLPDRFELVKGINIRRHMTGRSRGDIEVDTLPPEVVAQMIEHLGTNLVVRLLTEDFLPQIDWGKYKKVNNGGASFESIKK